MMLFLTIFEAMELITYVCIAWWWCNFDPIQATIDKIALSKSWTMYLVEALSCIKCMAFWLTLICTFDFILACAASLIAYTLDLCLNRLT